MAALTALNQTLPSQSNPRHVSFSSYLTTADDHFLRKLAESSRHVQPKKEDDTGEIGVFSAEKYFNGVVEVDHSPRISKFITPNKLYNHPNEQIDLLPPPPKPNIQPSSTTPSVRSESSWNSQIALLQQNRPTKTNKSNRKTTRKSFLSNLGCNCICSDSNSIDVEDQHLGDISLNKVVENLETQRKSLEVFGSPLEINKTKSFRKETRPSIPSTTDFDSDASSSDLFEIESVTGKVNPNLVRQGSDATSTCYAPSEASIEWSVVTASAADFSVMSDYEETVRPVGEAPRRRSSISLGCNSSKAVRVSDRIGNDNKLAVDQRLHRVSGSYVHEKRFNMENKVMEFEYGSMPRQRAFSALSVPRSQPSQLYFIR